MLTTAAMDGPARRLAICSIQRPPSDIGAVRTREELRGLMRNDLVWGRARWIDAAGLRLSDQRAQTRLIRLVADFRDGLAGLNGNPHTAILDLSTLPSAGVDVLAALPVVCSSITANGAFVICCEPRRPSVASLLEASGLVGDLGESWVSEGESPWFQGGRASAVSQFRLHATTRNDNGRDEPSRVSLPLSHQLDVEQVGTERGTLRLLRSVSVFDHPSTMTDASQRQLYELTQLTRDAVSRRVQGIGPARTLSGIAKGVLTEATSNAVEKSHARRMAIAIGVRDSPHPCFELAIVDNGRGMAEAHHATLSYRGRIPERILVADVWKKAYTDTDAARGPGRGIVLMIRKLLQESDARVTVRTGGVLLTMTRRMHSFAVLTEASAGQGTSIHVSLPLDRAS